MPVIEAKNKISQFTIPNTRVPINQNLAQQHKKPTKSVNIKNLKTAHKFNKFKTPQFIFNKTLKKIETLRNLPEHETEAEQQVQQENQDHHRSKLGNNYTKRQRNKKHPQLQELTRS